MEFRQKRGRFFIFLFTVCFGVATAKNRRTEECCRRHKLLLAFGLNKDIRNPHGFVTAISQRRLKKKARPNDRG
jgi:hypothetical protein